MSKIRVCAILVLCLVWPALVSLAQDQAPSMEEAIRQSWESESKKILAIARDDQAPEFDYTFSEGAQSFSEVLWHSARSIQFSAYRLNGMSRDEMRTIGGKLERPTDRAGMIAALEKAIKECNEALAKNADARMIGGLGHLSEQYGKLVGMYRANNIVPPNSRQ